MKSATVQSITAAEAPELFRAFADQTRLRLLNLLREGELCVCDLCEVLEESQPKVSRHLAYLRRVGLVSVRQQGKWKHYSIESNLGALQERLIACVGSCLGEFAPLAEDRERLKELLNCGRDCSRGDR
ncbi:MAG: metalloregulator ArsR/SmtB family transcription factor [Myxococcales bacterium]|nr:MAG: metalloregulator ArsR/SmtB family transcription factor [Myxococcales bacterium]